ncbi:MAG: hypothetical protein EOM91_15355 [Sphingobacteriia bacterium]|nr:hypothetical protein [Sphingobacteriia bacterium]NCC41241.1 hypothetical protein [Gammaproteobacteria bacterium]
MSKFSLATSLKSVPDEPREVDPAALREFAAGAKDHRAAQEPFPWEKYDPQELPKNQVTVRLNDHDLAILRYLATRDDISQQKVLKRIVLPELKKRAQQIESGEAEA